MPYISQVTKKQSSKPEAVNVNVIDRWLLDEERSCLSTGVTIQLRMAQGFAITFTSWILPSAMSPPWRRSSTPISTASRSTTWAPARVRPSWRWFKANNYSLRYSFFPWNRDRWSKLLKRHPDAKLPMNLSVAVPETSARLMRLANWQKRSWDGRQTALCWTCVSNQFKLKMAVFKDCLAFFRPRHVDLAEQESQRLH